MIEISKNEVKWVGVRNIDPAGRVFFLNGSYYRAVRREQVNYIESLLDSRIFKVLVESNLVPPTRITSYKLDDYGLVIQTETSPFKSTIGYLPPQASRDVAKSWININRVLAEEGYSLIDGHIGNFAPFGPYQKWIDIGSIQPTPLRIEAVGEFARCIFFPIMIMSRNTNLRRIGRHFMGSGGLSSAEMEALTGMRMHSGETDPYRVMEWIESSIDRIHFEDVKTHWGSYTSAGKLSEVYREGGSGNGERVQEFNKFLKAAAPTKAIDLGSGGGNFTVRIARENIPCLAVDTDEESLEVLNKFATLNELPISVRLESVTRLPIQNGVNFVSAMALTHHLALSQRMNFANISHLFANFTENALITEFMPWGLAQSFEESINLPDWYNLDAFCESLSIYFRDVDVVRPRVSGVPRDMIICKGRR